MNDSSTTNTDLTQKKTILVVDDQEINLILMRKYLGILGYRVETSTNGKESLDRALLVRPDLIIMDIMMPVMDGFEATKIIKSNPLLSGIPLIIMTSLDSSEDKVLGIEAGADDFISKPFDEMTLKARVSSLIRIGEYNRSIQTQYRRIQQELEMARILQNSILPDKHLHYPGISVCHTYIPCSELGGDFYSIIPLENGEVGFFIADVLGHGVQASLVTMILKTLFESTVHKFSDPSHVLSELNHRLFDLLNGSLSFATAAYLIINAQEGEIRYSTAAHPGIIHLSANNIRSEILKESGFILGLKKEIELKTGKRSISPGDLLLLYTDGLSEVTNEQSEYFGDEQLEKTILKLRQSKPAEIIKGIMSDLELFSNARIYEDDINLISVKYTGKPEHTAL